MDSVNILTNNNVLAHSTFHVKPWLEAFESPQRIAYTLDYLRNVSNLSDIIKSTQRNASTLDLLKVHSPFLINLIVELSEIGNGEVGENAFASDSLLKSLLAAVGTAFESADMIMTNKARHVFAMIRPPGHHASYSSAMGLCFVNNVALAINYLREKYQINKFAIIDIDDHFGNGTSELFYSEPQVLYISLHEYDPLAPWAGGIYETGFGKGANTNVNIPLAEGTGHKDYIKAIDKIVIPILRRFNPEIILVSAGFDGHYLDPVGNLNLTSYTFYEFAKRIKDFSKTTRTKRSLWLLEGGYNPFAMGCSIEAIVYALQNKTYSEGADKFTTIQENYKATQQNNRIFFELQELYNI